MKSFLQDAFEDVLQSENQFDGIKGIRIRYGHVKIGNRARNFSSIGNDYGSNDSDDPDLGIN